MISSKRIQTKRKTVYLYGDREYNTREALRDRLANDIAMRVMFVRVRSGVGTYSNGPALKAKALRRLKRLIPDGVARDADGRYR